MAGVRGLKLTSCTPFHDYSFMFKKDYTMFEKRLKKGTAKSKQGEDKGGGKKETRKGEGRGGKTPP